MTLFRAAQAAAAVVIDTVFGEPFTLRPMRQIGGRLVEDPDRPSVDLDAILTEHAALSDPIGERNASGMSKGVASAHATAFAKIEFKLSAVPFAVMAKDRFFRTETGDVYEVSGSPKTDLGNVAVRVTKLGSAI